LQVATRHKALGNKTGLGIGQEGDPAPTITKTHSHGVFVGSYSAVRRLTPEECERLQGFEPGYTLVPYRGKPAADGPRYKAIGNSMAVPVMRWIGERIEMVNEIMENHSWK
jgi:DNA (cytosine-5)-methyltransferase 1